LPHLSAALFAHLAGVNMVHVPYRGATPAIVDLMAGRIDMISSSIGDLRNGMQAGN
jgi:tripartite-type tricarboxylate transporter receptor subunit TctC